MTRNAPKLALEWIMFCLTVNTSLRSTRFGRTDSSTSAECDASFFDELHMFPHVPISLPPSSVPTGAYFPPLERQEGNRPSWKCTKLRTLAQTPPLERGERERERERGAAPSGSAPGATRPAAAGAAQAEKLQPVSVYTRSTVQVYRAQ